MPSTSLPITDIDPSSKQASPNPKLTSDQQHKLNTLIDHFNSNDTLRLPVTVKDLKAAQKQRLKQLGGEDVANKWTGTPFPGLKDGSSASLSDREKAWLTSERAPFSPVLIQQTHAAFVL